MLILKDAKKTPYVELDEQTKEHVYDLFKRYVVRKQISDQNTELSRLFSSIYGKDGRSISTCFNEFNGAFLGSNLISYLNYDECQTTFLKDMSKEAFNSYLMRAGSFDRQMALIVYSMRSSERIPNRLEFPVLVAYANMQSMVLEEAKHRKGESLTRIFQRVSRVIRNEFYEEHGYELNLSRILPESFDHDRAGKHGAGLWKQMMDYYMAGLKTIKTSEAVAFIVENFIFTKKAYKGYEENMSDALERADRSVERQREIMSQQIEEFPDSYNIADYDEVYSTSAMSEAEDEAIRSAMFSIFHEYLSDPIYSPKGSGAPASLPKFKA